MRSVLLVVSLAALGCSGCAATAARAVMSARPHDPGQLFRSADADGDGVVSRAEFAAAGARLFARLDRDGDGYLTSADRGGRLARHRGGGGGSESFTRAMDRDGDGKISREEFDAGFDRLFDRADGNHDGVVDAAEMAAMPHAGG